MARQRENSTVTQLNGEHLEKIVEEAANGLEVTVARFAEVRKQIRRKVPRKSVQKHLSIIKTGDLLVMKK